MQDIARRLRELRRTRQLSLRGMQDLLASAAGERFSHDSIRHYEQGSRTIPASYLRAVCHALKVSPAWLLLGDQQDAPPH